MTVKIKVTYKKEFSKKVSNAKVYADDFKTYLN